MSNYKEVAKNFLLKDVAVRSEGGCDVEEKEGAEAKRSIAETLLRDVQGSAAEKLALFEKLKARGGFAGEDRRELLKVENMLRTFAAMEKGS